MKKIIIAIILLFVISAIALTCFAGCSRVVQTSKLSAAWGKCEKSVYAVKKDVLDIGTLTIVLRTYENATDVVVGGETISLTGTLMEYDLQISGAESHNGSVKKTVAVNGDLTPVASYVESNLDGVKTVSQIRYSGKNATLTVNGEKKTFKTKGLVYDNEMLYFIVRASSVFDDSYSISFSVPDNKNGGLYTVNGAAGAIGSTTLDKFGELTTTRLVRLTANGEMGSSSNYATYSRSIIIPQENDAVIIKPLIKISEGGYTYELTSITTVE